ncbi:CD209 antigen-like protein A [Crassostrea virginica]
MPSYCVCAIVLWLVSLASFVEGQTLYSNAEAREVPQIQALETAVKRLEQENRALKNKLPRKHSCPQNWHSFGNSCYLQVQTKKTQEDAALICMRHGSKLVEIETRDENFFLATILGSGWYWTGGTDVLTEGEWVWPMTGTPLTLFDDWKEGEPNGHNGGEDCLEYGTQTTKKWNDNKCNATLKFICEKNAVY